MSHVIWQYESNKSPSRTPQRSLHSVEHVPAPFDFIPWRKRKLDKRAREQYVAMSYAVPGGERVDILAPTQTAKVLALTYTHDALKAIRHNDSEPVRTIAPFSSTAASQWSTSPLVRAQPKSLHEYIAFERTGAKVNVEFRPDRIKADLKRAPQLVRNYRAQKQLLEDMRIFV